MKAVLDLNDYPDATVVEVYRCGYDISTTFS